MDKLKIALDDVTVKMEEIYKLLALVADLKNKEEEEKRWVMLPLSRNELLACDGGYKDITRQDVHISSANGGKKVLCETCWEKKLKGDEEKEKCLLPVSNQSH